MAHTREDSLTPDGKRIAAGLEGTSIVIWDVRPAH
jgi:hypothetical protein